MSRIVISRHWHSPAITVTVVNDKITLDLAAEDFLIAVAHEMGNPALIMTKAQLIDRLLKAFPKAQLKIQEASAQALK
jgi:hypothetical protein